MKPTCYENTGTFKYNFVNMCGSLPDKPIINLLAP